MKNHKNRKKVILLYASVLMIGFLYNAGEVVGEYAYLLGFSI